MAMWFGKISDGEYRHTCGFTGEPHLCGLPFHKFEVAQVVTDSGELRSHLPSLSNQNECKKAKFTV